MSQIKWILAAIGALLAAFFGVKTAYERKLEKERDNAERAYNAALKSGDDAAAATAAAAAARSEYELHVERSAPASARVRAAVEQARRRRSEQRSGR